MPTRNGTDTNYGTDLHIRLKIEERNLLQKRANEYGLTLSQAARRIIFKKLDGSDDSGDEVSEKEAHYKILQAIQNLKATFKKVSIDVGRYVVGYEKAVGLINATGVPAVNTEQTVRTSAAVVKRLLEIQDGLNEVIRHFGGAEIHVAAKPSAETAIGAELAGRSVHGSGSQTTPQVPSAEVAKQKPSSKNEIPIEFTAHMFTISMDGVLLADCETFMDGTYEKIRLRVQVNLYRDRRMQTYEIDAVDFASRYKNVIPHLKKDRFIVMSGEFDFGARSYNGVSSKAVATVDIKTLTLPPVAVQ